MERETQQECGEWMREIKAGTGLVRGNLSIIQTKQNEKAGQ